MKPRCYLGGPIFGKDDHECRAWRSSLIELRGSLFNFVDPVRRDYRGVEHDNVADIVTADLRDIDSCQALLVNASQGASWGTAMEIRYAFDRGKRIVAFAGIGNPVSPWLQYHCEKVTLCMMSACEYLEGVLIDSLSRNSD